MNLGKKLALALNDLKTANFANYIQTLAALGIDISQELHISSVKELASFSSDKTQAPPQLSPILTPALPSLDTTELRQLKLHAELFAKLWACPVDSNNSEALKNNLNTTSRHQIHLGLLAIKQLIQALQIHENSNHENPVKKPTLDLKLLQEHEQKIIDAIQNYKTTRQKIIHAIAKTIAIASSISYGSIQTSIAVFFVGLLLFSPAGIPALAGLLAGSLISGAIYSYTNYCTQKDDIPYILNEIAGRDRFLQGFLTYKNKNGKDELLSRKQQAALGLYTLLLAMPAAAAIGAMGFTSVMSIPALLSVFGLTLSASFVLPFAAIIATIIAVNMTLFMLRSFHTFIAHDQGNLLTFLRRPFDDVINIINQKVDPQLHPKLNVVAKVASVTLCGLFCVMSVVGLAVSSLAGVNSMTALMDKLFGTSALVSASVGIAVGGVISFLSRSFFTIKKCGNAVVNFFKLLCHQTTGKVNKVGLTSGLLINLPLSAFFWMDSFIRPPTTVPLVPMPGDVKTAALATACTTVKDVGIVINSMFEEKKQDAPIAQADQVNVDGLIEHYSNTSFVKTPASLSNYSIFKSPEEITNHEIEPKQPQLVPVFS